MYVVRKPYVMGLIWRYYAGEGKEWVKDKNKAFLFKQGMVANAVCRLQDNAEVYKL